MVSQILPVILMCSCTLCHYVNKLQLITHSLEILFRAIAKENCRIPSPLYWPPIRTFPVNYSSVCAVVSLGLQALANSKRVSLPEILQRHPSFFVLNSFRPLFHCMKQVVSYEAENCMSSILAIQHRFHLIRLAYPQLQMAAESVNMVSNLFQKRFFFFFFFFFYWRYNPLWVQPSR